MPEKPLARGESAIPETTADEISNSHRAYRELRDLIVSGRAAPGTRLTEQEIAERLGVSRTPVRSALQRLRQEGYVEEVGEGARPRLVVSALTSEDAQELLCLIGLIEGMAAHGAALLDDVAREELAADLLERNEALAAAGLEAEPSRDAFYDLDHDFHQAYVDAAGGARVRKLHESIKPQAERYIRLYVSAHASDIATSVREHKLIIAAIQAGFPDWAERAVNANWRAAGERLRKDIESLGERGGWW